MSKLALVFLKLWKYDNIVILYKNLTTFKNFTVPSKLIQTCHQQKEY